MLGYNPNAMRLKIKALFLSQGDDKNSVRESKIKNAILVGLVEQVDSLECALSRNTLERLDTFFQADEVGPRS